MRLFQRHDVSDLKSMLANKKTNEYAPASLLIVIDEFAALVREMPEFVDGVVSIAERGRSLGIHLLLSTQRPSGSINENIQQNTNLRIGLRMLDSSESNNVIGTGDAAAIPNPLKGRGLIRLGPNELVAFQSAWSGAPSVDDQQLKPIRVADFDESYALGTSFQDEDSSAAVDEKPLDQLSVVIESIRRVAGQLNMSPGRVPWKPLLPTVLSLASLRNDSSDELADAGNRRGRITFGMLDDPDNQRQYPAVVDFLGAGTMFVAGNGGSGKTTLLTTLACSAALDDAESNGGTLSIFGFDFGSRKLVAINQLPQCVSVTTSGDDEGLSRTLLLLDEEFAHRQDAKEAAEHERQPSPEFRTILILIDNYDGLKDAVDGFPSRGVMVNTWVAMLERLVTSGREVGICVAITASRTNAISNNLLASIGNRYLLRQSDEAAYTQSGLSRSASSGLRLAPGQLLDSQGQLIQVSVPIEYELETAEEYTAAEEVKGLNSLCGALDDRFAGRDALEIAGFGSQKLEELVAPSPPPAGRYNIRLGISDLHRRQVDMTLGAEQLSIIGPPESGRSSALALVGEQLSSGGVEVWALGPGGCGLESHAQRWGDFGFFGSVSDVEEGLARLLAACGEEPEVDRCIIFDDYERFDERDLNGKLERAVTDFQLPSVAAFGARGNPE